jgi:periplasmic protein TonB
MLPPFIHLFSNARAEAHRSGSIRLARPRKALCHRANGLLPVLRQPAPERLETYGLCAKIAPQAPQLKNDTQELRAPLPARGIACDETGVQGSEVMLMSHAGRRGTTFVVSLVLHAGLALSVVALPLYLAEAMPSQEVITVLPPLALAPPPPPAPSVPTRLSAQPTPRPAQTAFLAPIASELVPEDEPLFGLEDVGGDGVIGGVPDGVVGSVMGDLPTGAPAPPPRVVRIGSGIAAPRLVRRVDPAYPAIAAAARVSATVQLEAEVDARGQVASVRVERGHPLFDEAAVAAVQQWRYQPLLLNGEPTGFVLTVTVRFDVRH